MRADRRRLLGAGLAALAGPALGQGFAGLGSDATGFALPDPATRLAFPRDHGPHPGFRVEWWYVTANLTGPDGTEYGAQWTLFRSATAPQPGTGWSSPVVWMAHAAVTTPGAHHAAERFARDTGQAGVTASPFAAWIDDWRMDGIDSARLTARGADFAYDLALTATGPLVPQGRQGYSVKAATGQASHYYSQPFYGVAGTLDLPKGRVPVTGMAWLDREWSSQPLAADQTGWDWVSLHLDGGEKLMGFQLRSAAAPYTVANWIAPDGSPAPQPPGALSFEPLSTTELAGRAIPTEWRLTLPARGLDVTLAALNPAAWMGLTVSYWEGPVRISGSHSGRGYLEMTGY